MNPGVLIWRNVGQTLQAKDVSERLAIDHLRRGEFILSLPPERASIDHEADPAKSFG